MKAPKTFAGYVRLVRAPNVVFAAYIAVLLAVTAANAALGRAMIDPVVYNVYLLFLPFVLWAVALLRISRHYGAFVGSAMRLLDFACDAPAMAAKGDELALASLTPRNGYMRVEAALLHKWAVSLVEVGRAPDAALVRRNLEESLKGRKASKHLNGVYSCMLLADISARLGDRDAAVTYERLFKEALMRSASGRFRQELERVSIVLFGVDSALYASQRTSPIVDFSESDLKYLLASGAMGDRLASEARLALAKGAAAKGDKDEELLMLAGASISAPGMRSGSMATEGLRGIAAGRGLPLAELCASLPQTPAVDPHPAILGLDSVGAIVTPPPSVRHVLKTAAQGCLIVFVCMLLFEVIVAALMALMIIVL